MRTLRTLIVIALAALAITACGSGQESKPAPTSTTAAPAPAQKSEPNRLHWVDWKGSTDKILLSKINDLRRAVERIGYSLALDGYEPISEVVDNETKPTVLVTQWLNTAKGTSAEVHSSYGVTAFTFKRPTAPTNDRPSPQTDGKPYASKWYRCPAGSGLTGGHQAELASLSTKSADDLKKTLCNEVTFGS